MGDAAIATSDLTKHYGKVVALDGLDLEVSRGEIFGFLGPNGSGKTTTIRLLLGLIRPTRGSATILGIPAGAVGLAHRHLGYVPGEVALWPQLTGHDGLRLLGNVTGWVDPDFQAELFERAYGADFEDGESHNSTFSYNSMAMVAGLAALELLDDALIARV